MGRRFLLVALTLYFTIGHNESSRNSETKRTRGILLYSADIKLLGYIYNNVGTAVAQFFKVLYYKSEGRWFDPRWCHWNF